MRMMRYLLLITGFISLCHSQFVSAGEWSVGVFGGQASFDQLDKDCATAVRVFNTQQVFQGGSERLQCSTDSSDSALGLNLTYHFNSAMGIEAGYVDLGEYTARLSSAGSAADLIFTADAPYLAAVSTLKLSKRFSLSARFGVYQGNIEAVSSSENVVVESESDTSEYWGASVNYHFNYYVSAQLRYDNFDLDVVSLGLSYRF